MSPAGSIDDETRRRADAPELWLLRAQRASRMPPTAFGLLCGGAVALIVAAPLVHRAAGDAAAVTDALASSLFFGASIAVLVGFTPRVFPGAAEDLERMAPVLPLDAGERALVARALTRMPVRSVSLMTAIGLGLGLLHASVLGLQHLPLPIAATQALGTLGLWVAMFWTVPPLLSNAAVFSRLGAVADADPLRPARLAPFGAAALRPTLFVIGMMCAYPVLVIGSDGASPGPSLIGFGASLASAFGLFFLPLRGIRTRIAARRQQALTELDARIDAIRTASMGTPAGDAELPVLDALLSLRERVLRAPSWPLDLAGARRVLLYVIAPPLTWAAAAVVESLVDRSL